MKNKSYFPWCKLELNETLADGIPRGQLHICPLNGQVPESPGCSRCFYVSEGDVGAPSLTNVSGSSLISEGSWHACPSAPPLQGDHLQFQQSLLLAQVMTPSLFWSQSFKPLLNSLMCPFQTGHVHLGR